MSQEYKQRMIKDMCKIIQRDDPDRAEYIIHQAATEYKRIYPAIALPLGAGMKCVTLYWKSTNENL